MEVRGKTGLGVGDDMKGQESEGFDYRNIIHADVGFSNSKNIL